MKISSQRVGNIIALGCALLWSLASASSAQARAGRGPGGPGPQESMGPPGFRPEMIERVARDLGIDEATVKIIKDKAYASEKEKIELRARIEQGHLDLRRLMDADKPDVAAVMKQVDRVGELETQMKKIHVRLMLDVRALLTPEQREKLQAFMMERRGAERRGPPMPMGEP